LETVFSIDDLGANGHVLPVHRKARLASKSHGKRGQRTPSVYRPFYMGFRARAGKVDASQDRV
jgi:hypothetical protein